MKRIFTLVLALCLTLTLSVPALAATPQEATPSAQLLYNLGLFRGVGTLKNGQPDFALDRAPTRAEAVTMLVRLLGAEKQAQAKTWSIPFTDVPAWAKPYVGYAYSKGFTNGMDATHFGSSKTVTTAQYLTFLLRALNYRDTTDFSWKAPWKLTDKLGITNGDYDSDSTFLRADAALLSANALYAQARGSSQNLLQTLLAAGAISKDSNVVVWNHDAVAFEEDFASFLFYPVPGSPATFKTFKIDKVTINGLTGRTLQVTTPAAVTAYLASIQYSKGGFGYIEVSYDEDAAVAAATATHKDSSGKVHPILTFTFTYTGTQTDGTKVTGTFSHDYYIDRT